MTRGVSETLGTELPAKFDGLFPWSEIDRRSSVAREFQADLNELWAALGGVDQLSVQKRWLTERVVWLRRRALQFEAGVMAQAAAIEAGTAPPPLPMDHGAYSNCVNVMLGLLKTLGIDRQARKGPSLREYMAGASVTPIKGASP
ncbi:MAG: hypothetical protein ACLQJ0_16075 [Steroidobacteraceae bacterium]|jgi:hypothetical protein